jgi:peptidoglycan hydrolase-like protein with peptidoglycan-binding domain
VVAAPKKKIQQSKPADDHVENSKNTVEKKKVVVAKTESASPKKPVVKQAQVATGGITRVRDVQTRLRRMGYPIRVVNGEPDKETRAAILKFQLEHDLPMDGAISGALVSALKVSEAARTAQVQ